MQDDWVGESDELEEFTLASESVLTCCCVAESLWVLGLEQVSFFVKHPWGTLFVKVFFHISDKCFFTVQY